MTATPDLLAAHFAAMRSSHEAMQDAGRMLMHARISRRAETQDTFRALADGGALAALADQLEARALIREWQATR